jgi:dolichol-phosphate mannosyltransferase
VSVVVPTYNERERLEPLVRAVFEAFGGRGLTCEMIVVDDNSPDGTGALADALGERYPLKVVHRPGKHGLGGAVMEGFARASGGVFAVLDGDLSHPPAILPELAAVVEGLGVDMAVGSRYIPGGSWQNWPRRRLILSRLACLMARPLTPVRDAMSGLFAVRREAVEGTRIASAGFKICLELQLRSRVRSVAEMPYTFVDRQGGRSKFSTREGFNYLSQLWMLYRLRLAGRAPRLGYRRVPPGGLEALRRPS